MPLSKKSKRSDGILHLPPTTPQVAPVEAITFTLGGREFEIAPIGTRGTAEAYDDAGDFADLILPMMKQILESVERAGAAASAETLAAMTPLQQVTEILGICEDTGVLAMLREFRPVLPKLAAIAARGTDPTITENDIRKLAGSPYNPEVMTAIILQAAAEDILASTNTVLALLKEAKTKVDESKAALNLQ